jgi:hypothetical protein
MFMSQQLAAAVIGVVVGAVAAWLKAVLPGQAPYSANGVARAIDGIRAALESRPAEPEKSAQRGRLAQQH